MPDTAGARFERLVAIMRVLRSPGGCPWDREQTIASLRPYVLEEAYEVVEAIDRGDTAALREELGDFLFEAVFLAQIAEEAGDFSIGDAIEAIAAKLVRRHPHVFTPDGEPIGRTDITSQDVKQQWEAIKQRERGVEAAPRSLLAGIPRATPALLRAYELGSRAATAGFDWPDASGVLEKVAEEAAELTEAANQAGAGSDRVEDELGDLLFTLTSLSRKLGVEPESALRRANDKFQRRFEALERRVRAEGREIPDLDAAALDARWEAVKREEDIAASSKR